MTLLPQTSPPTMPTLTDLPYELVEDILGLVHKDAQKRREVDPSHPRPHAGRTCKHLLPAWQSLTLRKVVVRGWYRVLVMCQSLIEQPHLASLVHSLELDYRGDGHDCGDPSARLVSEVFASLTNVTELIRKGTLRLPDLFLFPPAETSPLPRLQSVILDNTFSINQSDPFNPHNFVYLDFYPELDAITIISDLWSWEDAPYEELGWELPDKTKSWYISLRGTHVACPMLGDFLSLFPCIDTLLLEEPEQERDYSDDDEYDSHDDAPLRSVLPSLKHLVEASSLTALSRVFRGWYVPLDALPEILPLFPALKSVEVGGSFKVDSLFPSLPALSHLRRFIVSGYSGLVKVNDVKQLLRGPGRPPALLWLSLDEIWADNESQEEEVVQELVELAEVNGVKLRGRLQFIKLFL